MKNSTMPLADLAIWGVPRVAGASRSPLLRLPMRPDFLLVTRNRPIVPFGALAKAGPPGALKTPVPRSDEDSSYPSPAGWTRLPTGVDDLAVLAAQALDAQGDARERISGESGRLLEGRQTHSVAASER